MFSTKYKAKSTCSGLYKIRPSAANPLYILNIVSACRCTY